MMTSTTPREGPPLKKRRREATLYDAVAGRVQSRGFLPSNLYTSSTRGTPSVSTQPVAPEEVLFRRKHAPQRYEEDDIYFQERFLPENGADLPASELLTAIHAYASGFYGGLEADGAPCAADWSSLDETALLAMGILLDEQCKYELGASGHLALLEETGWADGDAQLVWNGRSWVPSVLKPSRDQLDRHDVAETTQSDEGDGADDDELSDASQSQEGYDLAASIDGQASRTDDTSDGPEQSTDETQSSSGSRDSDSPEAESERA